MTYYNWWNLVDYIMFLRWLWIPVVIIATKNLKRLMDILAARNSLKKEELIRNTDYNEDKIIAHLDFIINEALDQIILYEIKPKNIYYINTKIENSIIDKLKEMVPDRISNNLMQNLQLVYSSDYIGKYIGERIYIIVLNYVLEYNVSNSPEGETASQERRKQDISSNI